MNEGEFLPLLLKIYRCYSLKKKTRSKKTCCFYTTSFYITNYRILVLLAPTNCVFFRRTTIVSTTFDYLTAICATAIRVISIVRLRLCRSLVRLRVRWQVQVRSAGQVPGPVREKEQDYSERQPLLRCSNYYQCFQNCSYWRS